jgi:hypothetical protein
MTLRAQATDTLVRVSASLPRDSTVHSSGTVLPESASQWILAAIIVGITSAFVLFALHWARSYRTSEWKEFNSGQLGVLAIAIGAASGLVGAIVSGHERVLDLICAGITSVLVVQIGETLRSHHHTKRMQSLERALDSDFTYEKINSQLDVLERLRSVRQRFPAARPFFEEFLAHTYDALADSIGSLSEGTVRVNDTSRELTFNKDCLDHLAKHEVWAVSFEDGTFWNDPEGKDFLSVHEAKIKAGVAIHRIFVLRDDEVDGQRQIIECQIAMKIHCRILLIGKNRNSDLIPEDFVIYDDRFVRAATRVTTGPTTTLKHAILSCESRMVREYLEKRNIYKTLSEPAVDVLKRSAVSKSAATSGP